MITYDQAVYFLESILRMPPNWRDLKQEKPLEFLTLYLKRHAIRVPFQNMHMASVEEGHRWFPSEEEIANVGLSGKGGCCLHLNYFTKILFQAIGLDTYVVRGDHYCAPIAGTHCIVMVKLHERKFAGTYMIEVGGAYPMLEPVPMDKERLPFKTLQAGGFPYEFREMDNGWIGKYHIGGGVVSGEFTDKKEILRTYWSMKPRALWEFDYPMLETFTKPCYSLLLRAPALHRFFSNSEFRRLFPELPENANAKEKTLVIKPKTISKIGKVVATNVKPKAPESKIIGGLAPVKNGKSPVSNGKSNGSIAAQNGKSLPAGPQTQTTNGNAKSAAATEKLLANVINLNNKNTNGKGSLELSLSKMEMEDSDEEDEYEVVTEEEIESDEDDDLEDPKNFIFIFKRKVIVGDAKSRKVIKNYNSNEEMAVEIKKYFPRIPTKVVDKAIQTFNLYEPEPVATPFDGIL